MAGAKLCTCPWGVIVTRWGLFQEEPPQDMVRIANDGSPAEWKTPTLFLVFCIDLFSISGLLPTPICLKLISFRAYSYSLLCFGLYYFIMCIESCCLSRFDD